MQKVLDYIECHYDQKLNVQSLSDVAHFSPFHFHRQFSAYTGLTLKGAIQTMRLKVAARTLITQPQKRVLEVAIETGFESPEVFSRAFGRCFGMSPSQFRNEPDWKHFYQLSNKLELERRTVMDVEIIHFPETPIALLEHHGPETGVYQTTMKFIEWRKRVGASPTSGDTYGLHHDEDMFAEHHRFDIAVSYDKPIAENPEGVKASVIPAGRCAKVRHYGSREYIADATRLYKEWLPASGEELRDFAFFFHYLNVGPDVRDADMITDLYLPLL